ncbi:sugar ABC transporter permease [Mesorhizobium sp.]|uniref:carbohydrate ABC transporter permease n=1 Tax=Mesorhizobium sp. TaxID=1871066 RepID=UPI000FE3110A|nr:sugar ABC transporter permease [Mesorhizobium sp.]RWK04872.1 MAG: sugar ABC transporter permease [Mesorhizobium sp.]RWK12569.1 MAG: sugar ABC transporter permease [Mesorhizobium sp.]
MLASTRRAERRSAFILIAPFLLIYLVLFIYPTLKMLELSFTNAPLIGEGDWVYFKNYVRLFGDRLFRTAVWNTGYFVVLTVVPNVAIGLLIALMVDRLKGWTQSIVLAAFFLPYILPVSVVFLMWRWILDLQFGIAQYPIELFYGERVPVFRTIPWFLPMVGLITIWWTNGFNVLLFIAGLRNISPEIYDAAAIDGANRWQLFWKITWPLIWPVTALVATIQLILQLKIFDQVYLFSIGGRSEPTMVLVQYIYREAFQRNHGGYAATIATALFVLIAALSVLQYQVLRARSAER